MCYNQEGQLPQPTLCYGRQFYSSRGESGTQWVNLLCFQKVGTLDTLIGLSDELQKLDIFVEG